MVLTELKVLARNSFFQVRFFVRINRWWVQNSFVSGEWEEKAMIEVGGTNFNKQCLDGEPTEYRMQEAYLLSLLSSSREKNPTTSQVAIANNGG